MNACNSIIFAMKLGYARHIYTLSKKSSKMVPLSCIYAPGELSSMNMLDKSSLIMDRSLIYVPKNGMQCWEINEGDSVTFLYVLVLCTHVKMMFVVQPRTQALFSSIKMSSVNPVSYMQISHRLSAQGCLARTQERKLFLSLFHRVLTIIPRAVIS